MDCAAISGHLSVIKFLHENRTEGCTTKAMDYAASGGHLDVVKFLHENRTEGCTTVARERAVENGHWEVVQYLLENRPEIMMNDTASVEDAAMNGDLSVFTALQAQGKLTNMESTLRLAADDGHAEIIEFLLSVNAKWASRPVLDIALSHGHRDVVAVLFKHVKTLFVPTDMAMLLVVGAFDVWLTLVPLLEGRDDGAEAAMRKAGSTMRMETIRFIADTMGRGDLVHLALEGALTIDRQEGNGITVDGGIGKGAISINGDEAKWLAAIHGAFPESCRFTTVQKAIDQFSRPGWKVRYLRNKANHPPHSFFVTMRRGRRNCMHGLSLPDWLIIHEMFYAARAVFSIPMNAVRTGILHTVQLVYHAIQTSPDYAKDPRFTLNHIQQAAARFGLLDILQWLVEHMPLPIEPTLLDQAIYYNRLDVAKWLVLNCPAGCTQFTLHDEKYLYSSIGSWSDEARYCKPQMGLTDSMLAWLETNETARKLVDFGALAACAARHGDTTRVRELFQRHAVACMAHRDIHEIAAASGNHGLLRFLETIEKSKDQLGTEEGCSTTTSLVAAVKRNDMHEVVFHLVHRDGFDLDLAIQAAENGAPETTTMARVLKIFKLRPDIVLQYC